jgi:hypothetical protein
MADADEGLSFISDHGENLFNCKGNSGNTAFSSPLTLQSFKLFTAFSFTELANDDLAGVGQYPTLPTHDSPQKVRLNIVTHGVPFLLLLLLLRKPLVHLLDIIVGSTGI